VNTPNHLVFWKVRCLHSQRKKFFDRSLRLDESSLSDAERKRFFTTLENSRDRALLEFRSHFVECSDETSARLAPQGDRITSASVPEYFEDEDGRPLDKIGLAQILTGDPDPILRFEPQSVLRLGPSPMLHKSQWTLQKANNVSHFLQMMNRIGRSGWFEGPLSITSISGTVTEIEHPDADLTTTALTFIRQLLLKRDDVLNHAVKAYVEHIGHDRRRLWVTDIHKSFNACLEANCEFGPQSILTGYTTRQAIDIFTYGSGLFHRESNDDCESELATLITRHGRERLIIAFNSACRELLNYAFYLAPVMWQDVTHWVRSEGCAGPSRPRIADLFGA
jgi:hypothetical protein